MTNTRVQKFARICGIAALLALSACASTDPESSDKSGKKPETKKELQAPHHYFGLSRGDF